MAGIGASITQGVTKVPTQNLKYVNGFPSEAKKESTIRGEKKIQENLSSDSEDGYQEGRATVNGN